MLPPGPLAAHADAPPPTGAAGAAVGGGGDVVAEQVLEALPALLHPDERQAEVGDRVANEVVRSVLG